MGKLLILYEFTFHVECITGRRVGAATACRSLYGSALFPFGASFANQKFDMVMQLVPANEKTP